MQSIVRIALNTLESQYHRCYRYGGIGATLSHGHPSSATTQHPSSSTGAMMRTREQSQASFEGEGTSEGGGGEFHYLIHSFFT